MKSSLELHIGQQLTLTPQLQQAIRLLQLSTLDLHQEIQQVVDSNPLLEITHQEEKEAESPAGSRAESYDFQWASSSTPMNKRMNFEESEYSFENLYSSTTTLQDHLSWQLDLTPMSDVDRVIATTLIDAVNEDGFLTQTVEEIYKSLNSASMPLDLDEIEAVRHRLQQFEPLGCFCKNLSETLFVQLCQFPKTFEIELAKRIVQDNIDLLGQHNYRLLMKIYQINEVLLNKALEKIQTLKPKPGNLILKSPTDYIIPDVIVKKIEGQWQVNLIRNTLPKLSINNQYASMIQKSDQSDDNQFLKSNLQEARWFLKTLESRQETLLKVSRCIVEYQKEFFELGSEYMKPLILNDIAKALGLHESTISRVTTQKYLCSPRGLFELKYFFSSHVATQSGGECSSIAIHALIKKIIASENRKKPYSDSKIVKFIEEQGIHVARRTVAKYREVMGIAPSNERKTISD